MQWIFLFVAAAALAALVFYHFRVQKLLLNLDKILDLAISGNFAPGTYKETHFSKIEAKLARFLSSAKLKRSSLENDKNMVHEMVSDISHQTKTPIANILLYSQLLKEQPELSSASKALASQIEDGANKLSFLIHSLIKTSRLENGIVKTTPKPQNLYTLATSGAEDCRPKAKAKNITLAIQKPTQDIFARYDAKWCAEAVYNIIDNAVKYTPANGSVTVSLHSYETLACIKVTDTGKGIPPADLPKIFGRFYRSPGSSDEPGVGIGLYLAREIIQQCGGYIHAESPPGGGSIFSIYLSKL